MMKKMRKVRRLSLPRKRQRSSQRLTNLMHPKLCSLFKPPFQLRT